MCLNPLTHKCGRKLIDIIITGCVYVIRDSIKSIFKLIDIIINRKILSKQFYEESLQSLYDQLQIYQQFI